MKRSLKFCALMCAIVLISAGSLLGQNDRPTRLATLTIDIAERAAHGRFADAGFLSAAKSRFKLMSQLAETDPQAVLDNALSDDVLARIPAHARPHFESRETLSGELEVVAECEEHDGRIHRSLKMDDSRIDLYFADEPSDDLLTGAQVNTMGVLIGDRMVLEADGMTSAANKTAAETTISSLTGTTGEKRVLVILVNFQDKQTQPFTVEQARNVTFTDTSNYFREVSYGQTWLAGDVYGWYTIPVSSTSCDLASIANHARQAATNAGAVLSAYDHEIYAFPQNTGCNWTGSGSVGANPGQVWINQYYNVNSVGHELGHNFGLYHSRSMDCGSQPIGGVCTTNEYGDMFDIMGGGASAHINAFQKERLGWLNYGASPPIQTVTTGGTYWIEAYEPQGSGAKALKILKSTNPTTGKKTWYYLERRTPYGFDAYLANIENMVNGVVIHTGLEATGQDGYLLDMTPATTSWYDPALVTGLIFSDPDAGLTITTLSADNSGAWVRIEMASQACVRSNPTVSVSPGGSPWLQSGGSFAYEVTVSNNNSGGCSDETFNLNRVLPNGFAASFSNASLNISNGGSAAATLYVSSPATAGDGVYNVGVSATNSANSSYSASASVAYTVVSSLGVSASPGASKYSRSQTAKVTALVTGAGAPVNGASVTFILTKPNGSTVSQTLQTSSDGRAVFSYKFDRKRDPTGTYYVSAQAAANGYSGQAGTSFLVNK